MNRIVAYATAVAIASLGSTAGAAPAFTEDKAQVSAHFAGGIYMGDGSLNPYGLGLGARGGYTLRPGVYLGGLFDFFFGESEETTLPLNAGSVKNSANSWLFQGEVGYDIGISPTIVLRPKAGLGAITIDGESCTTAPFNLGTTCSDDSDGKFAFALGLEALFSFKPVFLAPEFRFNIVDDASALILALGVGAAF